jgi:solute carrier family 35 protein C2
MPIDVPLSPALPRGKARDTSSWTQLREMSFDNDNLSSFYHEHCTYLPAMVGWFLFSALLSSYNKFVFGEGHMAFPCPLLLTSIHFLIQWTVAHSVCRCFPVTMGTERVQRMSWTEWLSISVPCGIVTSGDIGLSNLSLVTISMTFYTMVKASTPIFVLGWAYLFGIERITWPLIGVIAVIAMGEFLTVAGEVDFDKTGFIMCLTASMLSGARWTLVQLKLQTMEPPLKTTLVTMKLLSPSMFWSMLFLSMVIEKPWTKFHISDESYQTDMLHVLGLGVMGGVIAVAMILCEFYLILHASAIILMIGGVMKEMITIFIGYVHVPDFFGNRLPVTHAYYGPTHNNYGTLLCMVSLSVSFFGDALNRVNVMGCAVVFFGVFLYKIVFHMEKEAKKAALQVKNTAEVGNLIRNEGGNDDGDDDNEYNQAHVQYPARSVELMGRNTGKASPNRASPKKMTEETLGSDDESDDDHVPKILIV